SMFSRVSDASKVALAFLVERLRQRGFQLFDIQWRNDHTARLGAVEIPRAEYLRRLAAALTVPASFVEKTAADLRGRTRILPLSAFILPNPPLHFSHAITAEATSRTPAPSSRCPCSPR